MGCPVCFLPFQYHFWAFLLNRTAKKLTRFKKKCNRAAKNLTGQQKNLQKLEKSLLENKKAYRRMSLPKIA
jgi:hypothetical protein